MNLKQVAIELFKEGVKAVLPETLISEVVSQSPLAVCGVPLEREVYLFGCGKASKKMAEAIFPFISSCVKGGFVVSSESGELGNVEIFESAHPIPDVRSIEAGRKMVEMFKNLKPSQQFIFLLSGGASAMMEVPVPPLTLEEIKTTTKLLLGCGADIKEINTVRKHLSLIKGGRLSRYTKARGIVLVISDVIGDDLETIGSGLLYKDSTTFKDAKNVLLKYGVYNTVPESVRIVIGKGVSGEIEETPKTENPNIKHFIIGNNRKALTHIENIAKEKGFNTRILTSLLQGEAKEVGKVMASIALESANSGTPVPSPAIILAGGETTVTLKGNGKGGRNQELVLSALKIVGRKKRVAVLSAGTDGIDGNSPYAGAVCDSETFENACRFNLDIDKFLENNDSSTFFEKAGGVVKTGKTGTNVMDIIIMVVGTAQ